MSLLLVASRCFLDKRFSDYKINVALCYVRALLGHDLDLYSVRLPGGHHALVRLNQVALRGRRLDLDTEKQNTHKAHEFQRHAGVSKRGMFGFGNAACHLGLSV